MGAWFILLPSCKKNDPAPSGVIITGVSPAEAFPGETVTITGTQFSAVAGENHVYFNNIEAIVSSSTATELKAVVPQGAATGKVKVELNDVFAESPSDFVVKQATGSAPVITSFSPASGAAGADITITGHHFSTAAAQNNVLFNETVATVVTADSTSLTVKVPQGAITGAITITVEGRAVSSQQAFAVEDPAAPAPEVTEFAPQEGIAGDVIIIRGHHFSRRPEENLVTIGGKNARVTQADSNQLRVEIPGEAATDKIAVKVNGKEISTTQELTVFQFPVIASYSPVSGPPGTEVTVQGEHFGLTPGANTVYLEFSRAQVTYASGNMLKLIVPEGAKSGKISITANGITTRSNTAFEITGLCETPQEIGSYDLNATVGQEFMFMVLCASRTPEKNVITWGGGAVSTAHKVVDATNTIGEGYSFVYVTVPQGAQDGLVTITVNGQGVSSFDTYYIQQ